MKRFKSKYLNDFKRFSVEDLSVSGLKHPSHDAVLSLHSPSDGNPRSTSGKRRVWEAQSKCQKFEDFYWNKTITVTVLKYQSDCVAIRNMEHTESLDSKGAELSRWKVGIWCVRWWGSSSWSASSCCCIFSILFRFDTDFSAFSARPLQSKRLLDRCQLSDSLPWGSAFSEKQIQFSYLPYLVVLEASCASLPILLGQSRQGGLWLPSRQNS